MGGVGEGGGPDPTHEINRTKTQGRLLKAEAMEALSLLCMGLTQLPSSVVVYRQYRLLCESADTGTHMPYGYKPVQLYYL